MNDEFSEQAIEKVSETIRPLIDPKDCGSIPYEEFVRRTAIQFLKTQSQTYKNCRWATGPIWKRNALRRNRYANDDRKTALASHGRTRENRNR